MARHEMRLGATPAGLVFLLYVLANVSAVAGSRSFRFRT